MDQEKEYIDTKRYKVGAIQYGSVAGSKRLEGFLQTGLALVGETRHMGPASSYLGHAWLFSAAETA